MHIYGSIGCGKTQLANLIARDLKVKKVWIRLREVRDPILNIKRRLIGDLEWPENITDLSKVLFQKFGNNFLIVLDDLPKISRDEITISFFINLFFVCESLNAKILSTSNFKLIRKVTEHLAEDLILEILIPFLNEVEISEILRLHQQDAKIINKYETIIRLQSKGHPIIVNEIIFYLRNKNWETTEEDLQSIFNYTFSEEFIHEIQSDLTNSIPNKETRDLLYRLNIIQGSFSSKEVELVAKVEPEIGNPLEKLNILKDIWIQLDSDSEYLVSPLLKIIKSRNLPTSLSDRINYQLGKSILTKRKLNQIEAFKAINYFIISNAVEEAGFILTLSLQEFQNAPDYFFDYYFFMFWYYSELPTNLNIYGRICIRVLHTKISLKKNKNEDTLFLLQDLELLTNEAAKKGIIIPSLYLILGDLYGEINHSKASKYLLLGYQKIDSEYEKQLTEATQILADKKEVIILALLYRAREINDIKNWLNEYAKLSEEKRWLILYSFDGTIPISKAFRAVYQSELSKKKEDRNWKSIVKDLEDISSDAKKIEFEVMYSYAEKLALEIMIKHQNQPELAEEKATDIFTKIKNDDSKFLLNKGLVNGFYAIGKIEKAIKYLDQAISLKTEFVILEKLDLCYDFSDLLRETNPSKSLKCSKLAFQLGIDSKQIDLILKVKIIGEYAINLWLNHLQNEAIYKLELGFELLLQSKNEDNVWQTLLMRYGHVFYYYFSLLARKAPPQKNIEGDKYEIPFKGFFSEINNEEPVKYYFSERRFIYANIIRNCFEMLGDLDLSKKWANYVFEEIRRNEPKYFSIKAVELVPYYLLQGDYYLALEDSYRELIKAGSINVEHLAQDNLIEVLNDTISQRPKIDTNGIPNVLISIVGMPMSTIIATNYLSSGENNLSYMMEALQDFTAKNNLGKKWDLFIETIKFIYENWETPNQTIEYAGNIQGDSRTDLMTIAYLFASLKTSPALSFQLHFQIISRIEVLQKEVSLATYHFISIPFFIDFWKNRIQKNRQNIFSPSFWDEKTWPRIDNAPLEKKLKYLIQGISYHLEIELSDNQLNWVETD